MMTSDTNILTASSHCPSSFHPPSSQGFKWFGSLTNLSFRRSSDKSDSKSKSADGGDSAASPSKILSPVGETTVDDLGAMRPRTASYVRSSESYTHVGTLPRLLMKRREKSHKGTVKAAEVRINM